MYTKAEGSKIARALVKKCGYYGLNGYIIECPNEVRMYIKASMEGDWLRVIYKNGKYHMKIHKNAVLNQTIANTSNSEEWKVTRFNGSTLLRGYYKDTSLTEEITIMNMQVLFCIIEDIMVLEG